MTEISTDEVSRLMEKLEQERAVDFRDYKPSSLGRRIQRRLDATGSADIAEYANYLDRRPEEYSKLIDSILINVTQFFRDSDAWEVMRQEVVPKILAGKRPGSSIRFWSAGCATGEEAYSLAIVLAEALGQQISDYDVKIIGTDIDEAAVTTARRAAYSGGAVETVPDELREKYLTFDNGRWSVKQALRRQVLFGVHDLVRDAPMSHVDLLSCRNVLIYMSVDLQNRMLAKFHYAIEQQGFLFLGKAESLLSASKLFNPFNEKWRIFRKQPAAVEVAEEAGRRVVRAAAETGEYQQALMFNESVLQYAPSGVVAIDGNNIVRVLNSAAEAVWGIRASDVLGKSVLEIDASSPLQEVLPRISQTRSQRAETRIEEMDLTSQRGRPFYVSVTLNPMLDAEGAMMGIVIVAENMTSQVRLRREREAAVEQLQATNEELETTNEELQSTNEELETTNEELQSTNEELETTNEELQATNEELSTTNDELSVRNDELNTLSLYLSSFVKSLDEPMIALNRENVVTTWNPAAEQFYGVSCADAIGHKFFDLGLPVRVSRERDKLRRVRETRKVYRSRPIEYKARSGEKRSVIIEYRPLVDALGEYQGVTLTVRDAQAKPLGPAES